MFLLIRSSAEVRAVEEAAEHALNHTRVADNVWILRGAPEDLDRYRKSIEGLTTEYLITPYEFVTDNADSWRDAAEPNSLPAWSGPPRNPYLIVVDTISDDLATMKRCLADRGIHTEPLTSSVWIAHPPDVPGDAVRAFRSHLTNAMWDCSPKGTDYLVIRAVGAAWANPEWCAKLLPLDVT